MYKKSFHMSSELIDQQAWRRPHMSQLNLIPMATESKSLYTIREIKIEVNCLPDGYVLEEAAVEQRSGGPSVLDRLDLKGSGSGFVSSPEF